MLLFTAWWGRKGGKEGRTLSSATVSSSHSFGGKKRNFKVYLVSKTRWEVSRTNLEEFTGRSRGGNKQNS